MISLDPYEFTETDALRTMAAVGGLWSSMMEGRSSHAAELLGAGLASRLAATLGAPAETSLADLGALASSSLEGSPLLTSALADAWNTLATASVTLRADGQMPPTSHGVVSQLSTSKGGVPKLALDTVEVSYSGVIGDVQGSRNHHGRPWQALCLYSDELINAFRAQGHTIGRGSAGENITISGLNWAEVRPGVRLRVGTVLADVQAYAVPCRHNAQWFTDGDFNHMSSQHGPVSRVYATVREPGQISTGDTVVLEP